MSKCSSLSSPARSLAWRPRVGQSPASLPWDTAGVGGTDCPLYQPLRPGKLTESEPLPFPSGFKKVG